MLHFGRQSEFNIRKKISPLFLCLECEHFSVQDDSVVLCVAQQNSLTLAQGLEGEVDPLKSLLSIEHLNIDFGLWAVFAATA